MPAKVIKKNDMDKKKFRKRLKYRYKPAFCVVAYEMGNERVTEAMLFVNSAYRVDLMMRSSAFRLLRLDFMEYSMIFSFDGLYYNYEVIES